MFLDPNYERQRKLALDLYNQYRHGRQKLESSTGFKDGRSEGDVELLQKQAEALQQNKYILTVVGESKSGKSQFINGLLKNHILPTGILQCTSAIIEIFDTDNPQDNKKVCLKVKYGNGNEEEINEITSIQQKLKEIAEIPDKYRKLPILQLNQFLIENRQRTIDDQDIQNLRSRKNDQDSSKPYLENSHNLDDAEFNGLIQSYLQQYRDLSEIPIEISIGYPLGFKSIQLRIVDTPGVNARGGIKDATLSYITQASAVVIIHSLPNIASESLQYFLENHVPKQVQDNIFMFLTHKSQYRSEDINRSLEEAKKLFPQIKKERIIAVDSMLKRIYDEMLEGKSARILFDSDEVFETLLGKYLVRHRDDEQRIKSDVYTDSNFEYAEKLLREFSTKAVNERLISFLDPISDGYRKQQKNYENIINTKKDKLNKLPRDFDQQIDALSKALDKYRLDLNEFGVYKRQEYTGLNSGVNADFVKMKNDYIQLLTNAADDNGVMKYMIDFNNDCEKNVNSYVTRLHKEYEDKMKELGQKFQYQRNINPPQIALQDIDHKARQNAYKTTVVPGDKVQNAFLGFIAGAGSTLIAAGGIAALVGGGPIGIIVGTTILGGVAGGAKGFQDGNPGARTNEFDEKLYQDGLRREAKTLISSVSDSMVKNIGKLFDDYDHNFQTRMSTIIIETQQAYDNLKNRQQESQELSNDIKQLEFQLKSVDNQLHSTNKLKNEIMTAMAG